MDHLKHPEVPAELRPEARKIEHGLHLWEESKNPPPDFIEQDFKTWPDECQEKHLAQAVLLAVRGTPGILVAQVPMSGDVMKGRDYPPTQFLMSELVDDAMGNYVEPVLGLATDRAIVWRFGKEHTMSFKDGLINQAFGAALVGICLELHEFVCTVWDEVEESTSPLAVVHTRLAPYIPLFTLLRELLDKHEGKCGTAVIRLLEEARAQYVGYSVGEITTKALLDHACRPFFDILSAWIYEGSNVAPWDFPLTRPSGSSDFMAWELAPTGLPLFLQGCAAKILQCGKLALILRKSGKAYNPRRREFRYNPDAAYYKEGIDDAFRQANAEVLKLLRIDAKLTQRISFLHHFLLCGCSDWAMAFFDYCLSHPSCALHLKVCEARWDELQRALMASAESSVGKFPKEWIEGLKMEPAAKSLIRMVRRMAKMAEGGPAPTSGGADDAVRLDMEVLPAIQLTATLEWPDTLVFHSGVMPKYQILGRLILRVKGLLRSLYRFSRRRGARMSGAEAQSFRALCALRGAMIAFLSNLEMYLLFEVIEPGFATLKDKLAKASTLDEIVKAHNTFLDDCIVATMATSEGLYKKLEMVFLTIRLFASALRGVEKTEKHTIETVNRFRKTFDERLGDLLREMQCTSTGKGEGEEARFLRHMLNRLDFNKYYLGHKAYDTIGTPVVPRHT